ncbi:hypothetical protein CC1G_08343 [Coprinopsis cinerea okayama7|uniref:Glycosyltransferase family 32 protein n=1 Tax=Coprinopsis cinerea (strain Okayama-7 / 130 / ATCC MYA-4618 / FGSC 9003) TaxID=240176 RepID=A8NA86_COPC7|nr:hypothetical protein CC1G_08343 [Coprinopsis cinerea okayama7\|eukprot:XP_001831739.2 hypothetical protein CC1G_08343 [Coprinopsis cinerea okayama7\
MDCYAFAGIVGSGDDGNGEDVATQAQQTFYHTYWRTDLIPFGPRQEYMLKSFFATQPLPDSHLILWSNGDLRTNAIIQRYLRQFPDSFSVKMMEISQLAMGTALEGSDKLNTNDKKAWVDGDLLRLLVLWNFGGVWVDMDSLLTRSLRPLLEHEFVTQWDCYNKPYGPLNGALMHFHAHSAYLCEAFHIMDSSPPPRPGSTDWGSILYTKLWRRLVRAGVPPFKVLPWCFSDGRSCRIDNRLPDPFKKDGEGQGRWIPQRSGKQGERVMSTEDGGLLDEILRKVFSVHLHNQWEKDFPQDGWVERLLLRKYDRVLEGDD